MFSLILVPVLCLVRTTVDSKAEMEMDLQDLLRKQQAADERAQANEALAEVDESAVRTEQTMQGTPYWETWVTSLLDGTGLADGWTKLEDKQELVGIALGGLGAGFGFGFPKGMSASEVANQRFEFTFECTDAAHQQSIIPSKRQVGWRTHASLSGSTGISHMDGNGIHVFHEKAGDYERAEGSRRYIFGSVAGGPDIFQCDSLSLDITQLVFMDKAMLHDKYRKAAQAMTAAGYSEDEMETARQAYHAQVFKDMSLPLNMADFEENHRKDVQELVSSGALKQAGDYGLVQEYSSSMMSASHSQSADESAGHFIFGAGRIQHLRMEQGKQALAFEFTQDCKKDARYREASQKLGDVSAINCEPGKKGLLVIHGDRSRGMGEDGFTGDRLVMYLQKS